jgi:hypothetical protein
VKRGSRVTIREVEQLSETLWGMSGTVTCRYGHPERATYGVHLDDGRSVTLWYYQLEEHQHKPASDPSTTQVTSRDALEIQVVSSS